MSAIRIEKIGDLFVATDFYTGAKVKGMTQEEIRFFFEFARAKDEETRKKEVEGKETRFSRRMN